MRILFVAPANSLHAYRWIDFFAKAGCDIYWLSLYRPSDSLRQEYPHLHPKCFKSFLPFRAFNLLFCWFYLIFLRIKFRPDLIHAHTIGPHGLLAALSGICPFVATAWGSDVLVNGKSRIKGPFVRFVLRKASMLTCDAQHMVREMSAMGAERSKIHVINFGIDTDAINKLDVPDEFYTSKFRGEKNAKTVISLRNHYDIYDLPTLLRAVPKIINRVENVRFIIAGQGPLTDSLKALASELGVADYIDFIGRYDGGALPRIFSATDVYVSTSLSDAGISASTAEAMSCSVPVVISNTGENDQWIDHGVNGMLFVAGDHDELAELVSGMLCDEKARMSIGQAGRATIVARNSYRNEMSKMLDLYKVVKA